MSASITLAGEAQIARKQGEEKPLIINRFIFANVPGLDPAAPVDRAAGKPAQEHIVYVYDMPRDNAGFVTPNQVVYSAQLGSNIGDWDFNYVGLEDADGELFAVSYVPLQQKRKNVEPLQLGNNITRNFLVAFDGAQELTRITIEASTWQHDFTVRLAGIDERERLSNRDLFGRACFFGNAMKVVQSGGGYSLAPGRAYIEGVRLETGQPLVLNPTAVPSKVWIDVCLHREGSDVVASFEMAYSGSHEDYVDTAGRAHYCVPIASIESTNKITDLRTTRPIVGPLVDFWAAQNGDYEHLRARATTKADVGLDQLPNAKSDDPDSNSSEILATTAALTRMAAKVLDPMTGMISFFAMTSPPPGWIKCNFAALSRTTYAALFNRIGTTYGPGDGSTTFNVPDARGDFIRAWDDGRGVDPGRVFGTEQGHMTASHDHPASADPVGDHAHGAWSDAQGNHAHAAWTDAQGNHTHPIASDASGGEDLPTMAHSQRADEGRVINPSLLDYAGNHAHNVGIGEAGHHAHNIGIHGAGSHSHVIRVHAAGGAETRPRNIAFLCCIKY